MSTPTPEDRKVLIQIASECGLTRDYRKEAWISAYAAAVPIEHWVTDDCTAAANNALAAFDQAFPS